MTRSNLTTKFHIGVIGKFEKQFKEAYKKENEKPFKGNILQYLTIGVIQNKRIPDISDCITLIKLGNNNCDDINAEDILIRWLENDDNKKRGIVGAFCDLCKDLCLDVPFNKVSVDYINNLEDTIIKSQEAMNKLSEMINQLANLQDLNEENNNKELDMKDANQE